MPSSANIVYTVSGLQLAVRAALSGGIALALASSMNLAHPIFSFAAAVVVTDLSPKESRQLGLRQIVGAIVGGGCGMALSLWLPQNIWATALGVIAAMMLCTLLRSQSGSRVAGFTCGIIMAGSNGPPWEFALFRMAEIVLGVSVAWTISWIPKIIKQLK